MELKTNTEIERKFLIEYPQESLIKKIPQADISEIEQTYLISEPGITARVRKRTTLGATKYTKTEKTRINALSCIEKEGEITEEEYKNELKKADPARHTVKKTRMLIRENGYVFEMDIYPFWNDKAILEVELKSESDTPELPSGIKPIKDVTADKRYKNAALAREIPNE